MSIDLVDKLPDGSNNEKYLVVAVCSFSKYVELCPLTHKTSSNVANWFLQNIIVRYGRPNAVRTDNGTEFAGAFAHLLGTFNITHRHTSVAYP